MGAFYPKKSTLFSCSDYKYCFYRPETGQLFPVKEQERLHLKPWNKPSFMRQGNNFFPTT